MRPIVIGMLLVALNSAAGAAETPKKSPASDRHVCANESATGSHIRKRVCVTREEERRRKEDQEAVRKLRSSSRGAANRDP